MEEITKKNSGAFIKRCMEMASEMIKLPSSHVWLDYDEEADVLYMSFRKPQRASRTIEMDDNILLRRDGRKTVGLTILNASLRQGQPQR